MKKVFLKGFLVGILCCAMLAALISCKGNDDESRLTRKNTTSSPTQSDQQGGSPTPAESFEDIEFKDKLNEIAGVLDRYYYQSIDYSKVAEGMYRGMVDSLGDPYTVYYNAEELEKFLDSTDGSYAGLGAAVNLSESKYPRLIRIFAGSPAEAAGLLPNDELIEVDGEDLYGKSLDVAVSKIRGPVGSRVSITVYREGEPELLHFEVIRNTVQIPTVATQLLDDGIGYISVSEFDDVTSGQFTKAVDELKEQGMRALVVDLRNNPGGLLSTVNVMLSKILPKGSLLVYMEDKYGQREEHYSNTEETVDVPMAILMNDNSASASEVFAGCLQDYGKAVLVGTQSYGKGVVQNLIPLSDGSAVKVTVSSYFTPKGRNIHKTGLTPDVEVPLADELKGRSSFSVSEDNQLQAAIGELKKQLGE